VTAYVIHLAENRIEVIHTVHYSIGGDVGGHFQAILNRLDRLSNQLDQVREDVAAPMTHGGKIGREDATTGGRMISYSAHDGHGGCERGLGRYW
jgi:hypothetical protein